MTEQKRPYLLLDGATGTNLMTAGLPEGCCVERWVLEHPQVIRTLQSAYADAGSDLVLTPTFGANEARLARFGEEANVETLNRALAALTPDAVGDRASAAGDVSPTGLFCEPFGDAAFSDVADIYVRQIAALADAGVRLIIAETMMTLSDARAAVVAAREVGLPVIVSLTVDETGHTLSGLPCGTAVVTLQAAGAAAVGLNCSTGPRDMAAFLPALRQWAAVPLLVKPNAGTPDAPMGPEEFAEAAAALAGDGVALLGGCCQSTPAHIAVLKAALDARRLPPALSLHDLLTPADPPAVLPDGSALPLTAENRLFSPLPEAPTLTAPLCCDDTLEDELPDADDADAVLIALREGNDPAAAARNAFLAPLPVVFTGPAPLLREALRLFPGRCGVLAAVADTEAAAVARHWGAQLIAK